MATDPTAASSSDDAMNVSSHHAPAAARLHLPDGVEQHIADEANERVIAAARWFVRCREFGLRTDCSWFELREAVKAIAPEEVNDDGE